MVIAHRLSTIIRADKIILVNEGKVAAVGTHNTLLENSPIYKNLYSKQLSANELMYFWYKLLTYFLKFFSPIYFFLRKFKNKEHPTRYKEKLSQIK